MSKPEIIVTSKGVRLEIDGKKVEGVYEIDEEKYNNHRGLIIKMIADNLTWRFENDICE